MSLCDLVVTTKSPRPKGGCLALRRLCVFEIKIYKCCGSQETHDRLLHSGLRALDLMP